MYFATDLNPIIEAMDAKAPRPIEDVLREYYPDCTIDCNGRAHAPYDGYECPFTGKLFRAGEYLPFEPDDGLEIVGRGGNNNYFLNVMTTDGKFHILEGSPAQRKAGGRVAKEQAEEFDRNATHVGEVKKRQVFELTLMVVFENMGFYGTEFTHYLRDCDGNSVVYKGTKKLDAKPGEIVKIKATVKSHWTSSDGRKATYINRPAAV